MTVWAAVLLGLVQGVAEFLPISSSGHLSILQNLFNLSSEGTDNLFFDVLLHLGTLISICVVYWADIVAMVRELIAFFSRPAAARRPSGATGAGALPSARLFLMIVIGTLPLFLVLPVNDAMDALYAKTGFIGAMLLLTGCMLAVCDRMKPGKRTEKSMRVRDALVIGLCQAVGTIPGISRSGVTITAGVATGLDRSFAVKYSFLLSVPAVIGANILTIAKAVRAGIDVSRLPAYFVGMLVAMLSGIAAISLIRRLARKGGFRGFAYYCWLAGVLTIILSLF